MYYKWSQMFQFIIYNVEILFKMNHDVKIIFFNHWIIIFITRMLLFVIYAMMLFLITIYALSLNKTIQDNQNTINV